MSTTSNVVGGVAALDIAKSSDSDNNKQDADSKNSNTTIKHMDDFNTNTDKNTTLVATPQTSKWSTIVILLSLGTVGLLFVIFYSVFVKDD